MIFGSVVVPSSPPSAPREDGLMEKEDLGDIRVLTWRGRSWTRATCYLTRSSYASSSNAASGGSLPTASFGPLMCFRLRSSASVLSTAEGTPRRWREIARARSRGCSRRWEGPDERFPQRLSGLGAERWLTSSSRLPSSLWRLSRRSCRRPIANEAARRWLASLPANAEVMELAKEGILKEPVRKVLRAGGKKRLSAH